MDRSKVIFFDIRLDIYLFEYSPGVSSSTDHLCKIFRYSPSRHYHENCIYNGPAQSAPPTFSTIHIASRTFQLTRLSVRIKSSLEIALASF